MQITVLSESATHSVRRVGTAASPIQFKLLYLFINRLSEGSTSKIRLQDYFFRQLYLEWYYEKIFLNTKKIALYPGCVPYVLFLAKM